MLELQTQKKLHGSTSNFILSINEKIALGSCMGIFGNSGVGKSTLLRIIAGLETSKGDLIKLNNELWSRDSKILVPTENRNIGFVTQFPVLFPNMTVKQQLLFSDKSAKDANLFKELVSVSKIENLMDLQPHKLSGGQQQRICLVRAILQKPSILLLDEPFSGLDYFIKEELIHFTKKYIDKHKITTFFVSHSPSEIEILANKIWIIKDGKVSNKLSKLEFKTLIDSA